MFRMMSRLYAFINSDELMKGRLRSWEKSKTGKKMGGLRGSLALRANQWLPSSSKALGPSWGCTDWSRDEGCGPADVPVLGHSSPLIMCIECHLASRKECNSILNTRIFSFYCPVSILHKQKKQKYSCRNIPVFSYPDNTMSTPCIIPLALKESKMYDGWRNGPVVKSTGWSSRGSSIASTHTEAHKHL